MSRRLVVSAYHDLDWYLDRLHGVEGRNGQFKAWCPCHADEGSSVKGLSITANTRGAPLMKWHSCGATLPDVHNALQAGGHAQEERPHPGRA